MKKIKQKKDTKGICKKEKLKDTNNLIKYMQEVESLDEKRITKEDAIRVLNSLRNEKNQKSVNIYKDKISSIQYITVQEELDKNDIQTLEDVKRYFEGKLIEEIEILENDEIEELEK